MPWQPIDTHIQKAAESQPEDENRRCQNRVHPYPLYKSADSKPVCSDYKWIPGVDWITSAHDNPRVTDDHVVVARDVTRSSVLDQLGLGGTQAESGGEHGDSWSESAHADLFFHDDVIKSARIEGENLVNGFVVLYAGDLVVLIMIHITGRKDEDALALL